MRDALLADLSRRVRDFNAGRDPHAVLGNDALAAATSLSGLAIREGDDGDERVMRRVVLPGRTKPAWVDADALAVVATFLMLLAVAETDTELADASRDMAFDTFALLYPAHRHWIPRPVWPAVAPETAADPLDDIEDLIIEGGHDALGRAIARLDASVTGDTERRRFLRGLALRDRAVLPGRTPAERYADIDAAIGILTSCSAVLEPHATWRALGQIALAEAWEKRYVIAGGSADLAAAESGYQQAVTDAPEETETYADAAAALGFTLARRGAASAEGAAAALAEAARWLRIAVECSYTMEGRRRHRDHLAAVMRPRLEAMPHVRTFPAARAEPATAEEHPAPRRQAEAVARLASQVRARVVTEEEAIRRVRDPSMTLSAEDVTALLSSAAGYVRDGAAERALPAIVLAMEAARSRWGAARDTVWWQAADFYVEAVRFALMDIPDPARFAHACAIVEEQIGIVRRAGDTAELAATLFAAGLLRYTPFTGQAAGLPFDSAQRLWRNREHTAYSAGPDGTEMPDLLPTIEAALPYLEEAARLGSGHERGRYLRSLTEVRTTVTGLRGEPNGPALLAGAREAFDLLDPVRDPLDLVFLLRVLIRFGEVMLPGDLDDLLPVSLAAVRDRDGLSQAASLLGEALILAREAGRPDLSRQLIESADRDLPNLPTDADRRTRWFAEVHVLSGNRLACPAEPFDAGAALSALREQMLREDWPAEARAATLIHVAAETLGTGNEELGRDLVTETQDLAPGLWQQHAPALYYLRGRLTVNAAMDLEDAGHTDLAARHLADAVLDFAECRQTDLALDSLSDGLRCVAATTDHDARRVAASAFILTAWWLRASTDEAIGWRLRDLYQILTLMLITPTGVSHDSILSLHQAAKGVDFAIAQGKAGPLTLPPGLTQMLGRVSRAEARLPHTVAEPEMISDDLAMLAYIGMDEAEPEADADTEQRNLQRAADRWISTELLASRQPDRIALSSVEAMQALLPAETVLISLFLGEHHPESGVRQPCLYGLAVTREKTAHHTFVLGDDQAGIFRIAKGDHAIFAHPVALDMVSLRAAIVADPLGRAVSREALPRLADEPDQPNPYLVGFTRALAGWQEQGKTHLVIWPHGPLHYLPFHLLSVAGRLVARDWTVTQVPGLGFLRDQDDHGGQGLAVFAAATGSPRFGLHREDVLETHAAAVAAAMNTTATVGREATRRRFLTALAGARYAHIAAHGAHNEWAPWYQCLFLSPEDDDDGRVFAHDILQADLRGVELVTMSSCESALGRFDANDNLRGLPAAFLAAGASAVIGCLWPVHPDVATAFFGTLYARLAEVPDRRTAFRAAQVATRDQYPAYRDWGAFCFIGDWRSIPATQGDRT